MPELFSVGETVRVRLEPECPGEFDCHGILPYNQGLVGVIAGVEPERKDGHYYRVNFYKELGHNEFHMWFTPNELETP